MEIIFEVLFEAYFELMMLIVPVEKAKSLKYKLLSVLLALIVFVGCLVLFGAGIVVVDGGDNSGWFAILAAVIISIAQIVAGCILYVKRNSK